MLTVGITGGIGSGKSYICNIFKAMGVPVFSADEEAKSIANDSAGIRNEIVNLFGNNAYKNNVLNRKYIAQIVFSNSDLLNKLNNIIHPAVELKFITWCNHYAHYDYVLKEAAILFESGSYKKLDRTIAVSAPQALRVKRILERDNISAEAIQDRMKNQWPADKIESLADFVIKNDDNSLILPQIITIDRILRE
jgi:dephospho-CoA kinase